VTEPPQKRDAERVKVEAFVKVSGAAATGEAAQEFVFRTRDLSTTGLFLYTKVSHIYPFKLGSTLQLELYDYDEFVTCKVVVVRVVEQGSAEADRYPTGFGVRIIECDEQSRRHLETMIGRIKEQGGLY
jgi:hypothetical protein